MSSHAVKQNGLIVLESSHKGQGEDMLANIDYCNPLVITQLHLLMGAAAQRRVDDCATRRKAVGVDQWVRRSTQSVLV